MKKKRISIICLVMALVFLLASCSADDRENAPITVDPDEQALNYEENDVMLYFANEDYSMLVGVERKLDIPVSNTIERGVIEALIKGQGANGEYIHDIINPQTRVLSVSRSRNTITVVLSKEFLDWSFIPDMYLNSANANLIKQLSLYSVVNSLVETALCRNVQILVDKNDNGTGQRLRFDDVGLTGSGVLGQLSRQNRYIMTSQKILERIFTHLSNRDFRSLYDDVANVGPKGEEKPVLNSFVSYFQTLGLNVEHFSIEERTDLSSQNQQIMMCSYVVSDSEGDRTEYNNIPVKLIKENGLWKISYEMLQQLFV